MSGLLTTVIILGVVAVGVAKRCEWFNICGNPFASGDSSTTTDTSTSNALVNDTPDKKDNGKKKKCGCCSCVQNSTNLITCSVPGGGSFQFTGGHSLDNQCSLCATDPNICADAKAADTTNKAITRANQNAQGYTITDKPSGISTTIHCASGYSLSKSGVCVKNNSSKNPKGNKGGDSPGCKSGETYTNCHYDSSLDKMVCSCSSNYTRALYSNARNNYSMSRFARVSI